MADESTPRSRVLIGATSALAVIVCALVTSFATFLLYFNTCSGDGGLPYSARDSVAGRFCDSPGGGAYFIALLILPVLFTLILGVVAVLQRKWNRLAMGIVVAVGVLTAMCAVVAALPNYCSDAQLSSPSSDCET